MIWVVLWGSWRGLEIPRILLHFHGFGGGGGGGGGWATKSLKINGLPRISMVWAVLWENRAAQNHCKCKKKSMLLHHLGCAAGGMGGPRSNGNVQNS